MPRQPDEPAIQWVPAGPDAPTPPTRHPRHGDASRTWTYLNADGDVIGYVNRYDKDGGKEFAPQIYDGKEWHWKSWPSPRPLYGLDRLADRPKAWVVVCEGEKSADAAAALLPSCVAVSASGGKSALRSTDWTPLRSRPGVILWPDNDIPDPRKPNNKTSQECFADLAAHLASLGIQKIKTIDPQGMSKGWDAADAEFDESGMKEWSRGRVTEYAGARVSPWTEVQPREPAIKAPAQPKATPSAQPSEPFDILGKPMLPMLKPEYLPRAIREFVFDQSEIVGADPAIMGVAALVAIAGCTNDNIVLQAELNNEGWTECARIWGAWVADPSKRKTPASAKAIKPLHDIDQQWRLAAAAEIKKYKIEHAVYKDAEQKYIKAKSKALMEGGSVSSLPEPPKAPVDKRLIAEDITVERLGVLMQDNPRGMVIPHDELSSLFGSMDAYTNGGTGGKDRSKYLSLFNGGRMVVDRMGREPLDIQNWSACIMGGIQPTSIRSIAHKLPEDGMLQRFLIVMAQDVDKGVDRAGNDKAKARYAAMLEFLANDNWQPRRIKMSPGAWHVLDKLQSELVDVNKLGTASERVRAALGKYPGIFVRLCLVYHVADAADRRATIPPLVSEETAWTVFEFMTGYLVGHLVAFYDDLLGESGHCEAARAVGRVILAHEWLSVENRDIQRYYEPWKGFPEWKKAACMRYLEDSGWLFPVVPDKTSRRVVRWDVNERVYELFHMTAKEERARKLAQIEQRRAGAFARAMQKTVTR